MKEQYIELMEKALSAYTDEHILRYLDDVKANVVILIAHGKGNDAPFIDTEASRWNFRLLVVFYRE